MIRQFLVISISGFDQQLIDQWKTNPPRCFMRFMIVTATFPMTIFGVG